MKKKRIKILIAPSGVANKNNFHIYYEDIVCYTDFDKKIFLGEKHLCRFCGTTDPKKFRKNISHTFPEFTGNKWIYSNDECKDCNSVFSIYENSMADYGHTMRSILGIRGKKGMPTIKMAGNRIRLENENGVANMLLDFNDNYDSLINEIGIDYTTLLKDPSIKLKLKQKAFIPLYLFKSIAKIAFSIMPEKELVNHDFTSLKQFLLNKNASYKDDGSELFFYIYHNQLPLINRKPVLMLFKKKEAYKDHSIPSYSFFFEYGTHVFQIFLPFCPQDDILLGDEGVMLYIIPELATQKNNQAHFSWLNGFSLNKFQPEDISFNVKRK